MFFLLSILLFSGCTEDNKQENGITSSKVYGHVMEGDNIYVPWANISITCGVSGRTRTVADEKGYYLADVNCPEGSLVEASAWSEPQDICLIADVCMPFAGGSAQAEGNISSAGYAKIDIRI